MGEAKSEAFFERMLTRRRERREDVVLRRRDCFKTHLLKEGEKRKHTETIATEVKIHIREAEKIEAVVCVCIVSFLFFFLGFAFVCVKLNRVCLFLKGERFLSSRNA